MKVLLGVVLGTMSVCVAVVFAYMVASSIERGYGGCVNFLSICDHPATIGASLGAGLITLVIVVIIAGRRKPRR